MVSGPENEAYERLHYDTRNPSVPLSVYKEGVVSCGGELQCRSQTPPPPDIKGMGQTNIFKPPKAASVILGSCYHAEPRPGVLNSLVSFSHLML